MAHAPAARTGKESKRRSRSIRVGETGVEFPLTGRELCCAQEVLWRGLVSNYRVSVPGTPSGIRAPPTIRHPQSFRATHGSPPVRGGLGGGRAALDHPSDSTCQTPRCARCFSPFRRPFPETRPPPPGPPLAGGELCCAQRGVWGRWWKGRRAGRRLVLESQASAGCVGW